MEASQQTEYRKRSKEVAVMLSTVLVGGAFAAVLILKWRFYANYYSDKRSHHTV